MNRSTLLMTPLAAVGLAALLFGGMMAVPLRGAAPLPSIHAGALSIDQQQKPDLSRFQARDGTWLAYRHYPARGADRVAILTHGSSASSDEMHVIGRALAAAGVAAVAIDARGHGASGTRGDSGYIGQLDDDLADLVGALRNTYPTQKLELIGHSSGGGFVARAAGGQIGALFDRLILLSPFLGSDAPTNRPDEGQPKWAQVDVPRIIALAILSRIGVTWGQDLPVIAFATAPESAMFVTSRYSYRLLADYGPSWSWSDTRNALQANAARTIVIAGENDELMNPPSYTTILEPLGAKVLLIPGADHMGIVYRPAALDAIVAAAK